MKDNKLTLLNAAIFSLILETSNAWMFWNISTSFRAVMYVAIFCIGLLNFQVHGNNNRRNGYFVLAAVFLFLAHVMKTGASFFGVAQMLLYSMIMWLVMVLPISKKKEILNFQTKYLSLLLVLSFAAWIVHYFYSLPFSFIKRPGYEHLPPAHNYYLFITTSVGLLDYRFHSIFLEPGHLGCIITFFAMANQFDFKNRYVLIMSILTLFTLSLAGYVLFFIGFLFHLKNESRNTKIFKRLSAVGIVLGGIWFFGIYYNGGDNYVNERVMERLQYDEETGTIAGDNRYTDVMDRAFEQTIYSSNALLGMPISQYRNFRENAGSGSGIKLWIIQKGIIGALMLFLGYYFIAKGSSNRRWAMLIFLLYVISSYQRMYFFWASYLIPFICGSALPLLTQQLNTKHKT